MSKALQYAATGITILGISWFIYSLFSKGLSSIQVTAAPPSITYTPAEAAQQDIQTIPLIGNPLAAVFNFGYQAGTVTGQALKTFATDLEGIRL